MSGQTERVEVPLVIYDRFGIPRVTKRLEYDIERTCHIVPRDDGPLIYQEIKEYVCTCCGNPMTDHDSYCSECGARVVNKIK